LSLLHVVQNSSGAHPASYPIGTWALFQGLKRPGRGADHSPSSSAEVRNGGAIPPLSHKSFSVPGLNSKVSWAPLCKPTAPPFAAVVYLFVTCLSTSAHCLLLIHFYRILCARYLCVTVTQSRGQLDHACALAKMGNMRISLCNSIVVIQFGSSCKRLYLYSHCINWSPQSVKLIEALDISGHYTYRII
jgi:hypothetical protein